MGGGRNTSLVKQIFMLCNVELISPRLPAASLLLIDTVRAIHHGTETLLSPAEFSITMPSSSSLRFRDLYADLFLPTVAANSGTLNSEDGLLLLTALLSDYLLVRRLMSAVIHPQIRSLADLDQRRPTLSPFVPLSPVMERKRLQDQLGDALLRWHARFSRVASSETVALYHYCQMIFLRPEVLYLPKVAKYPPAMDGPPEHYEHTWRPSVMTDEVHRFAWQVLEHSNARSSEVVAVWLAPIVFHAALAVWRCFGSTSEQRLKTLLILDPLVKELEQMPWPCCEGMVATLRNLPAIAV